MRKPQLEECISSVGRSLHFSWGLKMTFQAALACAVFFCKCRSSIEFHVCPILQKFIKSFPLHTRQIITKWDIKIIITQRIALSICMETIYNPQIKIKVHTVHPEQPHNKASTWRLNLVAFFEFLFCWPRQMLAATVFPLSFWRWAAYWTCGSGLAAGRAEVREGGREATIEKGNKDSSRGMAFVTLWELSALAVFGAHRCSWSISTDNLLFSLATNSK